MPAGTTAKRETAPDLHDLMAALDYAFNDTELLRIALLHPSAVSTGRGKRSKKPEPRIGRGVDNQRLEFLGDRVLGIVVAEMLFRAFPTKMKARWRAASRHWCARTVSTRSRARSRSAAISPSPAARKRAAAATIPPSSPDACEALIGAIYLDGSLETARTFVERHWRPKMDAEEKPPQDAKTAFAGMGAGRRPRAAALYRGEERRAAARSGLRGRGDGGGAVARFRPRPIQARGRTGRGASIAGPGGRMTEKSEASPPVSRCGFVAILGAPNAGKSTLVNRAVGQKVSIVSPKVQTTRSRVLGIVTEGATQLILVDTRASLRRAGAWTAPWSPPHGVAPPTPMRSC